MTTQDSRRQGTEGNAGQTLFLTDHPPVTENHSFPEFPQPVQTLP